MTLYLIRGLPGSGKSTLARQMVETHDCDHVEADMYFELSGAYQFDPAALSKAHQWCQEQTRQSLRQGRSVVVANTFSKRWEMQPYLEMARNEGASVVQVITAPFHTQPFPSIHNVPVETILKMRACWSWEIADGRQA